MLKQKMPLRLDGDDMIIGMKDATKLIGITIIACCAVLVCTMFLNFYLDISNIKDQITSPQVMTFYDAQVLTAMVITLVSGGCLLMTSVVMLLFYIKHYVNTHKKELGILKAIGYSNMKIAKDFWIFGLSVLIGTLIGYTGAHLLMPLFYEIQNEDKILPEIVIHFHPGLFCCLIIIPSLIFALISIFYGYRQVKKPVMTLIKDNDQQNVRVKKHPQKNTNYSFLDELKTATLKSRKTLVFFIVFASFCFSSMTQMSARMPELSSFMMGAMTLLIGIVLACTTLFLAITTVINGNTKTIAMMRVFGYSQKQCCHALLGGYRPLAYIGFIIGTFYQYILLKLMVDIVFKDIVGVPEVHFDLISMLISFVAFVIIYELIMYIYSEKIKKISIKEIMIE